MTIKMYKTVTLFVIKTTDCQTDFGAAYFVLACTDATAILSLYKYDSYFELELW